MPEQKTYEEKYFYKDSCTMKNKFGIRDRLKLKYYENLLTIDRAEQLCTSPIEGNYDLEHLKKIHKHLFQDVYEWAGKTRSIDIEKMTDERHSARFAAAEKFPAIAEQAKKQIQGANHLRGLSQEQASLALANTYAALNFMHPFPDGNGRAAKLMLSQLAQDAGLRLDYMKVNPREWKEASAAAMPQTNIKTGEIEQKADWKPLQAMFEKIIVPHERLQEHSLRPDKAAERASGPDR